MSLNPSLDNNPSQALDDAYWASLFQQEETIEQVSYAPQAEEEWPAPTAVEEEDVYEPAAPQSDRDLWHVAQSFYESDLAIQLKVIGSNKGGLLVDWNGLQGFVPASQLIDFPQFHFEEERTCALRDWVNKVLTLKVVEVSRRSNRLILSERAALVDADERERLLNRIQPGDKLEGKVTNLTDFGAFIDLGGVEGLVHISELSWSRVVHPSDFVEPGQDVVVQVLKVECESARVALSMKRLRPNPWCDVEKRYAPGQLVEGKVSNVTNFGAFVQLEEELEGLIHVSELAEGTILHPRNVVQKGDQVQALVLKVDGAAKRLALSLRGVNGRSLPED
ncbi:MAG: 30S ribosomal protein S1 [Anaerolineae bacterium]